MAMRHKSFFAPVRHRRMRSLSMVLCGALGFGAGLLNGLLGAAGGILLVSLLPYLPAPVYPSVGSDSQRQPLGRYLDSRDIFAVALAVMLPVSAVSFVRYWLSGIRPEPSLLALILLPAALGGLLGARLLERLSPHMLRLIFALLIALSGIRMLL